MFITIMILILCFSLGRRSSGVAIALKYNGILISRNSSHKFVGVLIEPRYHSCGFGEQILRFERYNFALLYNFGVTKR